MSDSGPGKKDFGAILEQGAQVDDIFKDNTQVRGANPFGAGHPPVEGSVIPLMVEEVRPSNNTPLAAPPSLEEDTDLNQVAIIDNDSLFCVNRKFAAIEALFRLVTRENYSFGQLISEILRIALEQVKSEAGSFLEIDHQNKCMFFRAVAGRSSQTLLNFTIPLGSGIAGFVCDTQQAMTLSSIDDSSVYLRSISDSVGFETKNMAAYPIVIRGVTFGCLELLNRIGEPQFTDGDKEVLQTICEYAGKVIENRLLLAAISKELVSVKAKKGGEEAA